MKVFLILFFIILEGEIINACQVNGIELILNDAVSTKVFWKFDSCIIGDDGFSYKLRDSDNIEVYQYSTDNSTLIECDNDESFQFSVPNSQRLLNLSSPFSILSVFKSDIAVDAVWRVGEKISTINFLRRYRYSTENETTVVFGSTTSSCSLTTEDVSMVIQTSSDSQEFLPCNETNEDWNSFKKLYSLPWQTNFLELPIPTECNGVTFEVKSEGSNEPIVLFWFTGTCIFNEAGGFYLNDEFDVVLYDRDSIYETCAGGEGGSLLDFEDLDPSEMFKVDRTFSFSEIPESITTWDKASISSYDSFQNDYAYLAVDHGCWSAFNGLNCYQELLMYLLINPDDPPMAASFCDTNDVFTFSYADDGYYDGVPEIERSVFPVNHRGFVTEYYIYEHCHGRVERLEFNMLNYCLYADSGDVHFNYIAHYEDDDSVTWIYGFIYYYFFEFSSEAFSACNVDALIGMGVHHTDRYYETPNSESCYDVDGYDGEHSFSFIVDTGGTAGVLLQALCEELQLTDFTVYDVVYLRFDGHNCRDERLVHVKVDKDIAKYTDDFSEIAGICFNSEHFSEIIYVGEFPECGVIADVPETVVRDEPDQDDGYVYFTGICRSTPMEWEILSWVTLDYCSGTTIRGHISEIFTWDDGYFSLSVYHSLEDCLSGDENRAFVSNVLGVDGHCSVAMSADDFDLYSQEKMGMADFCADIIGWEKKKGKCKGKSGKNRCVLELVFSIIEEQEISEELCSDPESIMMINLYVDESELIALDDWLEIWNDTEDFYNKCRVGIGGHSFLYLDKYEDWDEFCPSMKSYLDKNVAVGLTVGMIFILIACVLVLLIPLLFSAILYVRKIRKEQQLEQENQLGGRELDAIPIPATDNVEPSSTTGKEPLIQGVFSESPPTENPYDLNPPEMETPKLVQSTDGKAKDPNFEVGHTFVKPNPTPGTDTVGIETVFKLKTDDGKLKGKFEGKKYNLYFKDDHLKIGKVKSIEYTKVEKVSKEKKMGDENVCVLLKLLGQEEGLEIYFKSERVERFLSEMMERMKSRPAAESSETEEDSGE